MEGALVGAFGARQIEGLMAVPVASGVDVPLKQEMQRGLKVVFLDRPPVGIEGDLVISDNVGGAYDGVNHLVSLGHCRIGFIGDRLELFTASERHRGYRHALQEHRIPYDEDLVVFGGLAPDAAAKAVGTLMSCSRPASAIFTGNSLITIAVVSALQGVPSPPVLLGFDDFSLASLLRRPISVLAQDPVTIGQVATELLFRRISGDRSRPQRIQIGTRLILRDEHADHTGPENPGVPWFAPSP